MSSSVPGGSRGKIRNAMEEWEDFEEQVRDFEAWPPVSTTMEAGARAHFNIEQRKGYVEAKDNGLKSMKYVQESSVAAGGTVWVNVDENKTPTGSTVATFTVCGTEKGIQWQAEADPEGTLDPYGPVVKKRLLAVISSNDPQPESQATNNNVVTLGPTFKPVHIDSTEIDRLMWRPAQDSNLVRRAVRDGRAFRDPTNFTKYGHICRLATGGTEGEWMKEPGSFLVGRWKDYNDVGPDGSVISCTEEACVTRFEKITLHKEWTGDAWESNGYFTSALC